MKTRSSITRYLLSAAVVLALLLQTMTIAFAARADGRGDDIIYQYGFDDVAEMSHFKSYYLPAGVNTKGPENPEATPVNKAQEVPYTDYWTLGSSKITRTNLTTGENPDTQKNNIALFLNDQKFQYFEAEVGFYFGNSWGWAQFCFGAEMLGSGMWDTNAGVFMEQEGNVRMNYPGDNDVILNLGSAPNTGAFTKAGLHKYKVRVTPGNNIDSMLVEVWVDNGAGFVQMINKNCEYSYLTGAGYISLQAQNDSVAFESLKVTALNADGTVMKFADKAALQTAVDTAKAMDTTPYLDATVTTLTNAITAGEALLSDKGADQTDVDAAVTAISNAVAGLTLKSGKTALQTAVTEAKAVDLSLYTAVSYAAFKTAIDNAEAVIADTAATGEQINNALNALTNAKTALVFRNDNTALKAAVAEGKALNAADYTAITYAYFKKALDAAEAVLANADADDAQIARALSELNAAKGKLVKAPTGPQPIQYVYDFTDAEQMKDFDAYFITEMDYNKDETKVGKKEAYTDHWTLDSKGLTRSNLVKDSPPCTEKENAQLFLNTQKFRYFEAEMTFRFGALWGWTELAFGAEAMGNHMHHNNAGIYMQQEGHVNLSFPGNDGERKWDAYGTGAFKKAGDHTLKLRVVEASANTFKLTVSVDNHDGKGFVQVIEKTCAAENLSDRDGYISLQAQNDNVSISAFKVTMLDAGGNVVYNDSGSAPKTGDTSVPIILVLSVAI